MAYPALELEFEFRNKRFQDAQKGLEAFAGSIDKSIDRSFPVLKKELKNFLDTVAEALAQRHSVSWPDGTTDNTLSKRSSKAMSSVKKSIKVGGSDVKNLKGEIGGNFYLRTHEFGATIRPKRVKFLTVPLPPALTSRGIPKKMSAREWDKTFIRMSKNGNLIIFRNEGRKLVPLYVLKKEVKIKPRLGMGKTLEKGLPRFVDKAVDAMLKNILEPKI